MKKYLAAFIVCLFGSAISFGQNAKPTPQPTPTPDNDVVKISTNLIQVDVTAIDQKGNVVRDLRPDEIEIYENGEKQKITNFSFISTVRTDEEKVKQADKPNPNTAEVPPPAAAMKPERVRRTMALVVDDLSLSFDSTYQVRRALKKFVDEQMQDGDLVAIIRTGAGIGALQQFTSDKRLLYAAIDKVTWNALGSGGISAFAPIEATDDTSLQAGGDSASSDGSDPSATPSSTGVGQSLDDFRSSVFATGTLGALRYVVNGMSELPGRKSVILFSDGFKLFETDENGIQSSGRVMDFIKELIDTANRSSVVFYTIDARGLQYTGPTAADNISNPTGQGIASIISQRSQQLTDTQEGLSFLADETGGFVVKNSNDIPGGVRRVLDDQSYYLVAYEPDSDTFDPAKRKYNQLTVKVTRPGVKVRYRSGFFNVANREKPSVSPNLTPAQQMQSALLSPFAVNGIDLKMNALFGSIESKSFVRSLLHVNASDLKFTDEPNGGKKAIFDILAASFGDNGQIVDQFSRSYTLTITAAKFKDVIDHGFVYNFTFPVIKPGAYQYRVALRDETTGRIGSASQFIEVPDLKKDRMAASSIVIDSFSESEWNKAMAPDGGPITSDPLGDTAQRRIKPGSVLRYGYEIYDAKLDANKQPRLTTKVRVFCDGRLILDGATHPLDVHGQTNMQQLRAGGAVNIRSGAVGDCVMQVIVTDELAKKSQQVATQVVQFEVAP